MMPRLSIILSARTVSVFAPFRNLRLTSGEVRTLYLFVELLIV